MVHCLTEHNYTTAKYNTDHAFLKLHLTVTLCVCACVCVCMCARV